MTSEPQPGNRVFRGILPFLASGSAWFGIIAMLILLTCLSSHVLGWKRVSQRFGSREVQRIYVTINEEDGGGDIGTARAILWLSLPFALGSGPTRMIL